MDVGADVDVGSGRVVGGKGVSLGGGGTSVSVGAAVAGRQADKTRSHKIIRGWMQRRINAHYKLKER
jgi:hypothetical protein